MAEVRIGVGTTEDFFASGKELARRIDRREPANTSFALTFEDPADLQALLTQARTAETGTTIEATTVAIVTAIDTRS